MASFKTTIKSLKPKLFLTFDGETFDLDRKFTDSPVVIQDESGDGNHALLNDSNMLKAGYRAGMPSQVKLDQHDQHSLSFGYYGKIAAGWPKTIVEVPHTSSFSFQNDGQFTVGFMMRVDGDTQGYYRRTEIVDQYASFYRPVARKTGVFEIRHYYPWASPATLQVFTPGSGTEPLSYQLPSDYYDQDRFVVLTWETGRNDNNEMTGTARLYIDGYIVASKKWVYYDSYPNTNFPSSVFVGSIPEPQNYNSDRNTSNLQLDQFFILDYALKANAIGRLLKKIWNYEGLLKIGRPSRVYPFSDPENPNSYAISEIFNNDDGRLNGNANQISRNLPGPPVIPGSVSTGISRGGQASFYSQYLYYQQWNGVNTASDYTIETYFSVTSNNIGIILTHAEMFAPYNGLTVTINCFNNEFRAGALQIQDSQNEFASVEGTFNDGMSHHLACVKRGVKLELWVDGKMLTSLTCTNKPNVICPLLIFGALPGRQAAEGRVAWLASYGYALQEQQITARAGYSRIYRISGNVTLRGIPTQATVRFYSNFDGELVSDVVSDLNTGDYMVNLYDNRKIDIMVMKMNDPSVRYRVYGPVTPSEYQDLASD